MKRVYCILALGTLVLLSLTLLAVEPARAEDQEPAPGVARVSLIRGDVSTMRGDSGDWVASTVNAPVVHGDKVSTGEKSQAEVQLDYANVLRLAPRTEVKVADLTRTRIQLQVAQGLINYTVMKDNEADIEIDTPNMAVRPIKEGSYRIEVNSPSETLLIVRKGEAEVTTPEGSTTVEKGRSINVRGTDHPEYQIASAPGNDDWDKWNKERDSDIRDAKSYSYSNHYYTGAQDLDRNGHWVNVPDYGWSWSPYVGAGWAPYRDGSWVWEPYWGWTWVSYEPWGWAPYHYGRWYSYGSSWYWWPGQNYYGYYPTWGPAYVSFIGFGFGGRNWGFGYGYGYNSIGWCALGPYDRHYPWWGRNNSYNAVNVTNITNVTNVTNINNGRGTPVRGPARPYTSNLQQALSNGRMRGAITQVSTDDFVRGRVPRRPQPVDAATLRQAHLVQGAVPAVPTRESLRPVDRQVNPASLPRNANATQNYFTRRQPPAGPQSFAARQAEVQQMVQQRNPLAAERGMAGTGTPMGPRNAATPQMSGERNATGQPGAVARPAIPAVNQPTLRDAQEALRNRGREIPAARPGMTQPGAGSAATRGVPSQAPGVGRPLPMEVQGGNRQETPDPGWRRFGGSGAAGVGRPNSVPATREEAAPRPSPALGNQRQATQPAPQQQARPGWERFGTGQPRAVPDRPTTSGAPREARPAPTPSAAPGPSGREENQGGFRQFTPQERPAPTERNVQSFATGGEARGGESSGWNRSPARTESPRSFDRQPLELRKPITTERPAPRSFESSGNRGSWGGGERSAPSAPPRSYQGGGSRGGGGQSAPPARSFGGGGSRGGGGQSAPPPRSVGGDGGGGSNRGSGGGGGRSAPSSGSSSHSSSGHQGRH